MSECGSAAAGVVLSLEEAIRDKYYCQDQQQQQFQQQQLQQTTKPINEIALSYRPGRYCRASRGNNKSLVFLSALRCLPLEEAESCRLGQKRSDLCARCEEFGRAVSCSEGAPSSLQ